MRATILDLRKSTVGMTCEEFTTIVVAGGDRDNLPKVVQERLSQHENSCAYHQSPGFYQSMLDSFITPELESAAKALVEKYS